MNAKNTWAWVVVAAGLFAFIFFFERHWRQPAPGPAPVLPSLKAAAVTTVQVRPAGQVEIRAERTNGAWVLLKPIAYPAQTARVEALLTALEGLTPATRISAAELRRRPRAEEEFGFENPQTSIFLQQGGYRSQILVGSLTAPGDQVFLRVVGLEDIYVVGAELLKLIPRTANEWRDTALVDFRTLVFDRITITNTARIIELQSDATNQTWRLTLPIPARADTAYLAESLQRLQTLHVTQFVSDDPPAELEAFGLQPAELELAFANGPNPVARLYFGRSATNDASQVFARRQGFNTIVTVASEPLAPWRASFDKFRDRHLVSLPPTIGEVEVRGDDSFTLQPQPPKGWRIAPQTFPVDAALADDFLATLAAMEVVKFVQDAVTEPDLRNYGLASPARQITLKLPAPAAAGGSNAVFAKLSLGSTNEEKVFATRAGEDSVYAVKLADLQRLPSASWQLRERRFWNFTEHDVARLTIRQAGKVRELLRGGTNSWALAPGSQGVINEFAVEETAHRLGELSASAWVERGAQNPARYGITTNSLTLTFELKQGGTRQIQFGDTAPSQYPYAAVVLDQETWVLEFPLALYQLVLSHLAIPANAP